VKVAFVGLGRMGLPMARQLLRAGFPLTVYNRTASRALLLADDGATVVESPAEAAAGSDVVITMLADGAAVRSVVCGPEGVLVGAQPGTVLVEMSTIGPEAARRLADDAAATGVVVLDAPVSGSVAAAESATLTTIVGGARSAFDHVRPVLAAMTKEQLWLGAGGAGAAMKLALNGLIAATNQAIGEALVVAEACGIDRSAAYEAIAGSAVGSRFVEYKRDAFLRPAESPVAFTLALLHKDLQLYIELGDRLGVPLASASAAAGALSEARESQGDAADMAAVAQALRHTVSDGAAGRARS
jgi:3-hydroxyisobutyrate dehydrogenase-like beta-hydroxyacid dehydrogenase